MKTIKEIDQEINDLIKSAEGKTKKEQIWISSKISFLRRCRLYLETNPNPEFVVIQRTETLKKMESIKKNFELWKIGRCLSTYKDSYATYLSQMGMDTLKSQLRTLNYLLN